MPLAIMSAMETGLDTAVALAVLLLVGALLALTALGLIARSARGAGL